MVEKRMVYRTLEFFVLQAVAITFEDFVIYLAKGLLRRWKIELKPGKVDEGWAGVVVRVIGYCWVTLWSCFVLPIWLDAQSPVGFHSFDSRPISQFLLNRWKQLT